MKKCIVRFIFFIASSIIIMSASANTVPTVKWISAKSAITHLTESIKAVEKQSPLPVLWPTQIPAPQQGQLYANYATRGINPDYTQYWILDIGTTADCQGTRVCSVGSISAKKAGKISKDYETLPDLKKHPKQCVTLEKGYVGYYTPFHTEAGGVNPTMEWQVGDIVYTLSWRIDAAHSDEILLKMANLAIKGTVK